MRTRDELTEAEWAIVEPLLPPERGRNCRPALDNRPFVNGMLWIARTGLPWRELPAEYGKWNSVYQRFRRWSMTGVWDRLVRKLNEIGFFDGQRTIADSASYGAAPRVVGKKRQSPASKRETGPKAASRCQSSRPAAAASRHAQMVVKFRRQRSADDKTHRDQSSPVDLRCCP